jgi:alpha-tubulin suppressor-like RCC1 family protein
VLSTGEVRCWGLNDWGQLGNNDTTDVIVPTQVYGIASGATQVTAGDNSTCAIVGGVVQCWGAAETGHLNRYDRSVSGVPVTQVSLIANPASQIAAGIEHVCALLADGSVRCWGSGKIGELGDNTFTYATDVPATPIGLESGVASIATGQNFTCALMTDGTVKCWGQNADSQLGNNASATQNTPASVWGYSAGGTTATAIGTGQNHACAVVSGGVQCWGRNANGQLGNNSTVEAATPTDVVGLGPGSGATQVNGGTNFTCALVNGGVQCWGNNGNGRLGDNTTTQRLTPVTAYGLSSGVSSVVTGSAHTCALLTDGSVKCWGINNEGQLGINTSSAVRVPTQVYGLTAGTVSQIAALDEMTCALKTTGELVCWGDNQFRAVGNNSFTDVNVPVPVFGLTGGVATISHAHGRTPCVVMDNGTLQCWGDGHLGQLGTSFPTRFLTPVVTDGPWQ